MTITKRSRLDRPMPAFLWNPTDWQTDRHIQKLSWGQRGLLRELLDENYLRDGLPSNPAEIAEILAEPLENISADLEIVLRCFDAGADGKLRHPIIETERARQNEYRRSMIRTSPHTDARNGAQPRTDAPNGSGVEVEVEVEVEVKAKENLKPKNKAHSFAVPDWIPSEQWAGFCEMRQRSRKPFTDRAKTLIVQKLEKLRDTHNVAEILDQSTRNGWQDVFPLKQAAEKKAPSRHADFKNTDYSKGLEGFNLGGGQ